MATVYVGNLSWSTDNDSLGSLFKGLSVTSAEVQRFRDGTRSKGWGLVNFAQAEDAQKAIENYNNVDLDGRTIIVRMDRGATPKTDLGGGASKMDSKDGEEVSSTTLYIGNISWDTTSDDLRSAFSKAGKVIRAEVMTRNDGRSRGWGIVEMSNESECKNAIDTLNGSDVDNRTIRVEFQKPRGAVSSTRAPRRRRPRDENVEDAAPSNSLFVGNLPWSCTDDDLKDLFSGYSVTDAKIQVGFDGRSRGYGIVSFTSTEDAQKAISAVNGSDCDGRTVNVRFDRG